MLLLGQLSLHLVTLVGELLQLLLSAATGVGRLLGEGGGLPDPLGLQIGP